MALTRRQREILDFLADFIRTRRYSPSLEEVAKHFGLSSVATVHKHVANLEKKGFIKRAWNRSRSIDLITTELQAPRTSSGRAGTTGTTGTGPGRATGAEAHARVAEAPLLARFPGATEALTRGIGDAHEGPAGDSTEVVRLPLLGRVAAGHPIEAVIDRQSISVPAGMVGRSRSYVLQVRGDSMIGEHIQDGDFVIVEERATAEDGEKVVALLEDGEATLKTYRRQSDGTVLLEPANPAFETLRVREGSFRVQGVVIGVMRKYRR